MKKIWSRTLRPGEKWSGNIGRGKYIHFKALGDVSDELKLVL